MDLPSVAMKWKGQFRDAIVAHATSNLLLAARVLSRGDWAQWRVNASLPNYLGLIITSACFTLRRPPISFDAKEFFAMSSDAQISMEERPQPGKLRLAIQPWIRVIIPLAASILFLVLSNRLDRLRTVPNLNSLGSRLWFVAPTALCSALSSLFLLWFCLAIGDDEPHWAAAITNFGATGLPNRQRR
jgi:hypothetical protein